MRLLSNIAVTASLSLLLAEAVPAETPAVPTPAQPAATADEINIVAKKLCHGEPVVGTRIAFKRKCDTPAQLAQYQRQAREIIEEYRRRPCMAGAESGNNQPMPC